MNSGISVEFGSRLSYDNEAMNLLRIMLVGLGLMTGVSCVDTRPFPDSGGGVAPAPPMVLMPATSSVREQPFLPQVEGVLRRNGLDPVYRGRAEMLLEFTIEEGPVNVDTYLRLIDHGRVVALGQGRASGAPLINRNRVLEDSFFRALSDFERQVARFRPGFGTFR